MDYKTGTLIEFRNRPWVVQQSGDDDLMIINLWEVQTQKR